MKASFQTLFPELILCFCLLNITGMGRFFFFFNQVLLLWQDRRWMDRNTHQDNDDSQSDYDVVENLEASNLHVPARPINQDNEYAGRFFIYISAFLCFSYIISSFWNHLAICQWLKPISVIVWPFSSQHFFADIKEKTSVHELRLNIGEAFHEFQVRLFYWWNAKRRKSIVPPQAVVGTKVTLWMCEGREATQSEQDLLVGLQGHLSAAFHCGRTPLSRSRYGEKWGEAVVWADSLYFLRGCVPQPEAFSAAQLQHL